MAHHNNNNNTNNEMTTGFLSLMTITNEALLAMTEFAGRQARRSRLGDGFDAFEEPV
jgi:hypothetical protein